MIDLSQLDFYLGTTVNLLTTDTAVKEEIIHYLMQAETYLQTRISLKERQCARCVPIKDADCSTVVEQYSFNIGTALKFIFDFTCSCKKGSVPNKLPLRRALNYIQKEIKMYNNPVMDKENLYEKN